MSGIPRSGFPLFRQRTEGVNTPAGRKLARTPDQLTYQVRSFLWCTQKHPDKMRRYLHAPRARCALA